MGILSQRSAAAIAFAAMTIFGFRYDSPTQAAGLDCERLRQALTDSTRSGQGGQFEAAADRQRAEIARTVAYSQQIGCNNKKFLFFGSDPPAQCDQIHAQIGRMRSNLQDLESRAGETGGRSDLIARFNAQCANQASRPPNLVDALFGRSKPNELQEQPLAPEAADPDRPLERSSNPTVEARAGGKAVCVRSCDGAFFPLSYSANGGSLDNLAEICRALCPNAEVSLYTYPVSGEIEQAVSINGARYMDSPTALRYRRVFDPSCSCRRRGQTWASALVPAESLLGKDNKSDIIVSPEKAAELSRPKVDLTTDAKAKPAKPLKGSAASATPPNLGSVAPLAPLSTPALGEGGKIDANGVDMNLRDATAAIGHESSGIGGGVSQPKSGLVGEDQGKTFDETGPDGVKRRVRVVGN